MNPTGVNNYFNTYRLPFLERRYIIGRQPNEPERVLAASMDKKDLRRLVPGLYRDAEGVLYLKIHEFLSQRNMPDQAEVRAAILDQIRKEFGDIEIVVIEDDGEAPNQTS